MDFGWNEEQNMLKDMARKFFEKECPKSIVKEMMTDDRGHVPEIWQKMAELGWLGLIFEERYKGSGGSYMDLIALLEEMGKAMLPGPFFSSVILGGLVLAEGGMEDTKERYLPSLIKGELILTLALTEEEGLWTSRSIQTRAEKGDGGYLLTGRKMFVLDAHLADPVLVVARTGESEEDITILAVDPASQGVSLHPLKTIAGDKQFEMIFDRVPIPPDRLIGREGEGWDTIQRVWPKIVVARCAQMLGGMEQVLEMTVRYAKERHQFGVPIGIFQAIQHYCVDMLTHLETARFITHQAAWQASCDLPCSKEASMAKAICSESFNRIVATAHQIHGGIGFTEEHDLHIYTKHAKGWELMMGNASEHRSIVAKEMGL